MKAESARAGKSPEGRFAAAFGEPGLYALVAGCFLRLFYVIFSTIYDRQYDIGMIDLDAGHTVTGGHLAYIQYLFENGHLPDFDPTSVYQFNHPPLHHAVSALWLKFASLFLKDTAVLEESLQIVPFLCSLLILAVLYRIVRRFSLGKGAVCFVMALFAFHPALVLLSGSVNNDCMSLLLTLLCVDFCMAWSRRPSAGNIAKLALAIGLGMMAKQNVAEMAFPIAFVFLYVLVRRWKEGGFERAKGLIGQFALFGAISLPLGLWFYLRNMVLYDMPLVWIYTLPEDSWQYTGNVPVIHRFLWPVPSEMVDNLLHFKLGCGYNVWMQIVRTSVLGEWDMADVGRGVKVLAVLLMLAGAALAAAAFLAFLSAFVFSRGRAEKAEGNGRNGILTADRILFVSAYFVNLLFYLKFAYDYPQECSMHFRYIEIELLFPAVALSFVWQGCRKRWTKGVLSALLAVFCALSAAMIAVWCLG
mgnify:FL=1